MPDLTRLLTGKFGHRNLIEFLLLPLESTVEPSALFHRSIDIVLIPIYTWGKKRNASSNF